MNFRKISNKLYILFFSRLFSFKGRSGRKEYTIKFILAVLCIILWECSADLRGDEEGFFSFCYTLILLICALILFIQYFPLAVRRLHDFNVNGWWILILFIPCGQLIMLWLMFKKGTPGSNYYGVSSNDYHEDSATSKYNLLVFGGIVLSVFSLGFYLNSLREDKVYSLLAAKTALEYYKRENYEEALKGIKIAISFTPKEASLYRAKGDILLKLQRYNEAIQDYDKAIELNLNEIDAYNKKIFVLFKQSNYTEALKICDLVSERTNDKDNLVYVYIMKASILNKTAQYKEALTSIEKALSLDPNNKKAVTIKKHALEQL